jgi:glucose-6-phosphate isomerase
MGQLIMFFELAVVYLAEMLGVNAFDQPGVEESKQMMYALLGRKGFEAKRHEIEKMMGNFA